MTVTFLREDGCGILLIDHPPVNALGVASIAGLRAGLAQFEAAPELQGLILRCAGRTFVAGGDIADFERPDFSAAPLNEFLLRLEAQPRPVVAELFGSVLGGGLELAMACHGRVAAPGTLLGLPEISLGLIPGSHGTQRLPRLIGLERAAGMMLSGKPVPASEAELIGLIDGIAEDTAAAAKALIMQLAAGVTLPRTSARTATGDVDAVRASLQDEAARRPWLPALAALAEVVPAALGDFTLGCAAEAAAFARLVQAPSSRGLRHVFMAERAAARVPGLPADVKPRPVHSVGVLGVGTMGAGIAMNFALIDLPVTLVETTPEALERGIARIETTFAQLVKRGRLSSDAAAAKRARMTGTTDFAALGSCDVVIEAVFEDMALKLDLAAKLGAVCKPGAIIASNTSTLDVDRIAAASGRPGDVLGTHFFSPAHIMRLLEIVRGRATAPDVLATWAQLARRIGKTAVVSGVCYGFIGNRMAEVYMRESEALQLEGLRPGQIDGVVEDPAWLGMAMGPSRMLDMAGVDVGARTVVEWLASGEGPRDPDYRIVCRTMYARELHGQKTGQGYYRYEGRAALENPAQAALVADLAVSAGIAARPDIPDQEIFERLLFPMVNEAARILEEGIAQRGGDIDVVWTAGYGFPAWRGGPLFMADEIGLARVVERLDHYARQSGNPFGEWDVSPLLRRLAASGGRISGFAAA